MKLLNEAYAVLSDPKQRAAHDAWIEDQLIKEALEEAMANTEPARGEARQAQRQQEAPGTSPARSPVGATQAEHRSPAALDRFNSWPANAGNGTYVVLGCAAVVIAAWVLSATSKRDPVTSSQSPSSELEQIFIGDPKPAVVAQPTTLQNSPSPNAREFNGKLDDPWRVVAEEPAVRWSPNGKPWPTRAAYLDGFQRRAASGLSILTIDNTSGGADVYVKLCRASADRCDGLRHVFIPLGSSFTMSKITQGRYDIRYRALDNGVLAKSEPIALKQIEEVRGIRYSTVRLTLYRVAGGNTTFESLPEDKF